MCGERSLGNGRSDRQYVLSTYYGVTTTPCLSSVALQDRSYRPGRADHSTHEDRCDFAAARAAWGVQHHESPLRGVLRRLGEYLSPSDRGCRHLQRRASQPAGPTRAGSARPRSIPQMIGCGQVLHWSASSTQQVTSLAALEARSSPAIEIMMIASDSLCARIVRVNSRVHGQHDCQCPRRR